MKLVSRKVEGRYEYEIAPGEWVTRQRVSQLRRAGVTLPRLSRDMDRLILYGQIRILLLTTIAAQRRKDLEAL
ncbi:MAG: hypothetical protein ABJA98_01580 [Acidobacteriota bacterium]